MIIHLLTKNYYLNTPNESYDTIEEFLNVVNPRNDRSLILFNGKDKSTEERLLYRPIQTPYVGVTRECEIGTGAPSDEAYIASPQSEAPMLNISRSESDEQFPTNNFSPRNSFHARKMYNRKHPYETVNRTENLRGRGNNKRVNFHAAGPRMIPR